jgi:hypothetical protein
VSEKKVTVDSRIRISLAIENQLKKWSVLGVEGISGECKDIMML